MEHSYWIQTFSGKKVDLLHPDPDQITIEDIAHALSNLCRFTGHVLPFYSVAQHCIEMSWLVAQPSLKLTALLHDAAEAYIGDVSSPVKRYLSVESSAFSDLSTRLQNTIYTKYNCVPDKATEKLIKQVDSVLLIAERDGLMNAADTPWLEEDEGLAELMSIYNPVINDCYSSKKAKSLFLQEFHTYICLPRFNK